MIENLSEAVLALQNNPQVILPESTASSRSATPSALDPYTSIDAFPQETASEPPCMHGNKEREAEQEGIGSKADVTTSYMPSRAAHSRPALPHEADGMYIEELEPSLSNPITTNLVELAQLLRRQWDIEQRCVRLRSRLYMSRRLHASTQRFVRIAQFIWKNLIDGLRIGDQGFFASLYYHFHDLSDSLQAVRRNPMSELDPDKFSGPHIDSPAAPSSFLSAIPLDLRNDIVEFLVRIRTDPDFVASRICRLSPQELSNLTNAHGTQAAVHSVFGFEFPRSEKSSPKKSSLNVFETKELLTTFATQDPFSALVFMPFASPVGLDSSEEHLRTDMVATVCSKLILHSRPGADQFIFKILDTWAPLWEWPGKEMIEFFLLQALNDGEAIIGDTRLDPDSGSRKTLPVGLDTFLEAAVCKFFNLIAADAAAISIPTGIIAVAKAIKEKLRPYPKRQSSVHSLIINKWLFGQFFYQVIVYPESNSLLLNRHISERARSRILFGIADRLLKYSLDTSLSSKRDRVPHSPAREALNNVSSWISGTNIQHLKLCSGLPTGVHSKPFLMISPSDITTLVNTLYPCSTSATTSILDHLEHNNPSLSSVSVLSPRSNPSPSPSIYGDGSSILSRSASSLTSLSTYRDFYHDDLSADDRSEYDIPLCTPSFSDDPVSFGSYGQKLRRACNAFNASVGSQDATSSTPSSIWDILVISPNYPYLCLEIPDTDMEHLQSFDAQSTDQFPFIGAEKSISQLLRKYEVPTDWISSSVPQFHSKSYSVLENMLVNAMHYHQHSSDYWGARRLYFELQDFRNLFSNSERPDACDRMLGRVGVCAENSIHMSYTTINECGALLAELDQRQTNLETTIENHKADMDTLRKKMWYLTDVWTSRCYEEARTVANALRVIRLQKDKRKPVSVAKQRNASKSVTSDMAQMADMMTSAANQGAYEKLSDEQVDTTKKWMRQSSMENSYCSGEEVIHRLNLEIDRCISKLVGPNVLESPVLWTSELYRRERETLNISARKPSSSVNKTAVKPPAFAAERSSIKSRTLASNADIGGPSDTSDIFWSPPKNSNLTQGTLFNPRIPPSRNGPLPDRDTPTISKATQEFLSSLRKSLVGFFFSDFMNLVFPHGSETDEWMASDLVIASLQKAQHPQCSDGQIVASPMNFVTGEAVRDNRAVLLEGHQQTSYNELQATDGIVEGGFPYEDAYKHFLFVFDVHPDPYAKLNALVNIKRMVSRSEHKAAAGEGTLVVGDKVTQRLLQNPATRPKTLFRNLQYLTALMSGLMDRSPYWPAFNTFALAALSVKYNVCQSLILTADQIVAYHTQNRGHHPPQVVTPFDTNPLLPPAPHNTMAAAAKLWLVTAKEGHAIAQRELATFYLTHPELLPRAMLPLTPPRNVFRPEQVQRQTDLDPERSDPYIMCVALHWMEESARGGDKLALGYLRDREELGAIP